MFKRVMVANRGEIARRIIRTLNKMGIESVAICSEADQNAGYLQEATMSIVIGPALAKDSYLCEDAILEAALQTDCEAIHPGFGFLSENATFAERCKAQKLTFIGPSPQLISLMGDKARARQIMAELGVPVLFGSEGVVRGVEEAKAQVARLGCPVLLKARAGGGGKGMRLVERPEDLESAFAEAEREALSAFKDGALYVEKFVKNARHIEFQILGDNYGKVIFLGERECSVQRKNQKLIEETPASGFREETRQEMARILTEALKKIGYTNAGTMEFLLDADGKLYFMEMNTRIQVEHPVTELVFGVDIVEWQVRVACGERIALEQEHLKMTGAAIECRINAEDPSRNFLPTPGLIEKFRMPEHNALGPVRVDTHVQEGYRVAPFYDSMLAKVIVHGETREKAVLLMKKTLEDFEIQGVHTTLDFHRAILESPEFVRGTYDCSFIEKNLTHLLKTTGNLHHGKAAV